MKQIWKSKDVFLDENINNDDKYNFILNKLASVSTDQIKSLRGVTFFYLSHFTILSRKNNCESSDLKVSFLRKLHRILDNEVKKRAHEVLIL